MAAAIVGNFVAAALARADGLPPVDRAACAWAISWPCWRPTACRAATPALLVLLPVIGACGGVFALFTMYLPPLFPTLLRTTGAGFCYNIGRIAAAVGTVFFGLFSKVGDYRLALLCARLPLLAGDNSGLVATRSP